MAARITSAVTSGTTHNGRGFGGDTVVTFGFVIPRAVTLPPAAVHLSLEMTNSGMKPLQPSGHCDLLFAQGALDGDVKVVDDGRTMSQLQNEGAHFEFERRRTKADEENARRG